VDARGNLGVVLFFRGAYADAIRQLRAALKSRPALPKIQALLGIVEKRTGELARSSPRFERSVSQSAEREDSD